MSSSIRIIFMGTPEFAVSSLDILVTNGYNVVAVITAPDKPAGRGLQLQESPVKKYAVAHNIPVLQPLKLKDPIFLDDLRSYQADLQIIVAFRMLPTDVWNMPPLGSLNLHASLLPNYRGAAPINWAVINGEKETGLTTFFLQHEIDTGDIILQEKLDIGENETAGELHDRMMVKGAELVLETVKKIKEGSMFRRPQAEVSELKPAPKIFKEDCKIDWSKSIDEIHNFIRGLSPFPGAWTVLDGKVFKIYRSLKEEANPEELAGTIIADKKKSLKVAVHGGYIQLLEAQLEGKKRMNTEEFLKGYTGNFKITGVTP